MMSASCGASIPPMPLDIRNSWRAEWVMEAWSEVRKRFGPGGIVAHLAELGVWICQGKEKGGTSCSSLSELRVSIRRSRTLWVPGFNDDVGGF